MLRLRSYVSIVKKFFGFIKKSFILTDEEGLRMGLDPVAECLPSVRLKSESNWAQLMPYYTRLMFLTTFIQRGKNE